MKNTAIAAAILFSFFLVPFSASAETAVTTSESNSITGTQNTEETKKLMMEKKKDFQEQTETMKKKLEAEKEAYKQKVEELRNKIQVQKQEYRTEVEGNKEEFKAKVEAFKSERKKLAAQRVDERLEKINDRRTEQLTKSLERLSELLDKYSSRTAALKTENVNTSSIETAIDKAQTAISDASDKIAEQAAREYTAQITDEETAGKIISETSKKLREDLKAVTEIVKEARESVREVAKTYAGVRRDAATKE